MVWPVRPTSLSVLHRAARGVVGTALIAVGAVLPACSGSRQGPRRPAAAPPRAEFLLESVDSAFWVSTTTGQTHVRGVPIVLARLGDRWYELYAADDDYSYDDALLVGERLYRRDLLTNDSIPVFADTIVPRLARQYARAHPDDQPLGPDEDGEANPSTQATAEIDVLDVFGPFLSYEYHVDVDTPGSGPWHATRRGVVDLRSGREAALDDIVGVREALRVSAAGRRGYDAARDSVKRERSALGPDERRAADAVARLRFDPRSFNLAQSDGRPAVVFAVPGRGAGPAGNLVELDPIAIDSADWWPALRRERPTTDPQGNDRWRGAGYAVVARYDTSGEVATLSIVDSARREWPLGAARGPLNRIDWLDRPPIGADERRALTRAFNAASLYGEDTRVAAARRPASKVSNLHLVSRHATVQDCARKPARIVGAHDASACQPAGQRVRRGGVVDDGRVRGDRRVPALAAERGHRVDRPRRFSRADSPGRPGRHESERELRRANFNGSRRTR
jgi:hypothetical protein